VTLVGRSFAPVYELYFPSDFCEIIIIVRNILHCLILYCIIVDLFFSLEDVLDCLPKKDRRNLLATLQTYWLLKRRSRNGLPLLRRLQVAIPPATATKVCLSHII